MLVSTHHRKSIKIASSAEVLKAYRVLYEVTNIISHIGLSLSILVHINICRIGFVACSKVSQFRFLKFKYRSFRITNVCCTMCRHRYNIYSLGSLAVEVAYFRHPGNLKTQSQSLVCDWRCLQSLFFICPDQVFFCELVVGKIEWIWRKWYCVLCKMVYVF